MDYEYNTNQRMQKQPSMSLGQLLKTRKQAIGNALLDQDPSFTGFVSVDQFDMIIQSISPVNSSDIDRLASKYDPSNSGYFNYFTLLSDLCDQAMNNSTLEIDAQRSFSKQRNNNFDLPQDNDFNQMGYSPRNMRNDYNPPMKNDYNSSMMNDYNPPMKNDYNSSMRNDYNPPMKNDFESPRGVTNRNFDDDSYNKSQKTMERGYGNNSIDEIIRVISSQMDSVFSSSSACFQKWRGYDKFISANDFVRGAARDFKIDVTIDEAQEIINRYGGCLSLSNFMKMIVDGMNNANTQSKQIESEELSPEDKVLLHVARQAKGKDLVSVFDSCDSIEMIVQSLRTLSIYVLLTDIRPAFNKYGIEGMLQKIQSFISMI